METMETMETTKVCTKCGRTLPISEFSKCSGSKDGLQHHCKKCKSLYMKGYYKGENESKEHLSKVYTLPELAKFKPRELINELKARGYKGELTFVQKISL